MSLMMQADEEEGSPTRVGANLVKTRENREFSGSPPGVPSPAPFPPEFSCKQRRTGNRADKIARNGMPLA